MSDHQIVIGDDSIKLDLIREDGRALYEVLPQIPQHRDPLLSIQDNWVGGHGQYEFTQPDLYFEGQSIDTTQDGRIILGPYINQVGTSGGTLDAPPVCFCWFSAISKLMVATAAKMFWYVSPNFVEQDAGKFTGKVITGMYEFNKVLFVSLAGTDEYYYSTTGSSFTECTTLAEDVIHGFKGAPNPAGTANILWGWKLPNEIFMNTSGINNGAEWDSGTNAGDTSNNITNIFLANNNLMVGKEDNLYHYDSDGGIHPLMDDLLKNRSAQNFKYVTEWQTGTYFSLVRGISRITAYDAYGPMGPLLNTGDIGKIGDCVGLAADKDWIYAAFNEGTYTHIYKGRQVARGGGLRWEWCPWVSFLTATYPCATMRVVQHSATDRRLWFGYGDYAAYVILSDNPTADSAATFAGSGFLRMSYEYGTNKYWDKLWQSVVTETKACTTSLTATVKYRKDTETSATTISGTITKNGVRQTFFANPLDCKRIQFEIHLAATSGGSTTPEVLYFEARGIEKPEVVRVHQAVYSIGDEPTARTKTIRDKLRDAAESTTLIKFSDLRYKDSSYAWVVLEPGYPQEIEVAHEKGKQPELGLRCRFREVNYPAS